MKIEGLAIDCEFQASHEISRWRAHKEAVPPERKSQRGPKHDPWIHLRCAQNADVDRVVINVDRDALGLIHLIPDDEICAPVATWESVRRICRACRAGQEGKR